MTATQMSGKKSLNKPALAPKKTTVSQQIAFLFDEGGPTEKEVLGGKGAGLVELVSMGVPVPPGFTLTTALARAYSQHGTVPGRLSAQVTAKLNKLEKQTGRRFGDCRRPLLVSVRSGAAVSMPGMMDTVLNLGLNPEIARAMAADLGREARFAWDSYRRFLAMFGEVVLGMEREGFEAIRKDLARLQAEDVEKLSAAALEELCGLFRQHIASHTGKPMVDDVRRQLDMAIEAVLRSWKNERAVEYRRIHRIDNGLGTAVNVQAMVFGNRDENSCAGVVFSHDVNSGECGLWGEYLVQSQGEDVVAGIRTPDTIEGMAQWNAALHQELGALTARLAEKRGVPVEVEFTVESGKLYALQVRNAKLAPQAAATLAVRAFWAKRCKKAEALAMVSPEQVETLRRQGFEPQALAAAMSTKLLARGLAASPGAAVGRVVCTSAEAVAAAARGEKVILLRPDTSPDDLPGMQAAEAIVTNSGGSSCHAAVVARGLRKPAVVGADLGLVEPYAGRTFSVDGNSGAVILGEVPLADAVNKKEVNIFLKWYAEEEAKRWPAPRLNLAYFTLSASVEQLIADFYMSDMLANLAQGTSLAGEATALRTQVHTAVAERLAVYLLVAVGGEIRHLQIVMPHYRKEHEELRNDFKVRYDGRRGEAQARAMAHLATVGHVQHIRFAELCEDLFRRGAWNSRSVGGPAWAAIAKAALCFLNGSLSHSLFADHTFDLQHNNGSVFGKHHMITGDRYRVHAMLEAKKRAKTPAELVKLLSSPYDSSLYVHNPAPPSLAIFSDKVRRLYEKMREHFPAADAPPAVKKQEEKLEEKFGVKPGEVKFGILASTGNDMGGTTLKTVDLEKFKKSLTPPLVMGDFNHGNSTDQLKPLLEALDGKKGVDNPLMKYWKGEKDISPNAFWNGKEAVFGKEAIVHEIAHELAHEPLLWPHAVHTSDTDALHIKPGAFGLSEAAAATAKAKGLSTQQYIADLLSAPVEAIDAINIIDQSGSQYGLLSDSQPHELFVKGMLAPSKEEEGGWITVDHQNDFIKLNEGANHGK